MIMALALFPDSPTLFLCDPPSDKVPSHYLSYKLGIYIFVPLTFMSVFIILLSYSKILYLIQKHVKSTENSLGAGKRTMKNKVVPAKGSKKVMVNNFIPPDFSIVDNDFRGSKITLASLGKEEGNNDKGDNVPPLDARKAYDSDEVVRSKGQDEPKGKRKQSIRVEAKKTANISSKPQNVDIPPIVKSISCLNESTGKNSAINESLEMHTNELVNGDDTKREFLSVSDLESGFKATYGQDYLESGTMNRSDYSIVKSTEETKRITQPQLLTDANKTQKVDDKHHSVNTSNNDSGFSEHKGPVQQALSDSKQKITLLRHRMSQLAKN